MKEDRGVRRKSCKTIISVLSGWTRLQIKMNEFTGSYVTLLPSANRGKPVTYCCAAPAHYVVSLIHRAWSLFIILQGSIQSNQVDFKVASNASRTDPNHFRLALLTCDCVPQSHHVSLASSYTAWPLLQNRLEPGFVFWRTAVLEPSACRRRCWVRATARHARLETCVKLGVIPTHVGMLPTLVAYFQTI